MMIPSFVWGNTHGAKLAALLGIGQRASRYRQDALKFKPVLNPILSVIITMPFQMRLYIKKPF